MNVDRDPVRCTHVGLGVHFISHMSFTVTSVGGVCTTVQANGRRTTRYNDNTCWFKLIQPYGSYGDYGDVLQAVSLALRAPNQRRSRAART